MEIYITPNGDLRTEPASDSTSALSAAAAKRIANAFAVSTSCGLAELAGKSLKVELPESLVYWREIAVSCVRKWSHQTNPQEVPAWDEVSRMEALLKYPPGPGGERLTVAMLGEIWAAFASHLSAEMSRAGVSTADFLATLNPLWHALGRVTFHLAENKKNPDYPFAFLATYAKALSGSGELRHIPLAKALQEYAGQPNELRHLLGPVRICCGHSPLIREMFESRAIFKPQLWTAEQAHSFLQQAAVFEESGLVLRLPDWWKSAAARRPHVQVSLDPEKPGELGVDAMMKFSLRMALGDQELSPEDWAEIMNAEETLIQLKGQWVEVDRERLKQVLAHWEKVQAAHADGISFAEGMRWLAGFGDGVSGAEEFTDEEGADWSQVVPGEQLKELLAKIRNPQVAEIDPEKWIEATLRPYQRAGVAWLLLLHQLRLGACLADDMGLGKTLQSIAFLTHIHLAAGSLRVPSLLIVPASLLGNWRAELERFAPQLRFFIAHRSQNSLEKFTEDPARFLKKENPHLVITTYAMIKRQESLRALAWNAVVLDEAQAIKNPGSAQTKAIKELDAKSRIALSGTPVENKLTDLWSLFDFLNRGLLGGPTRFARAAKGFASTADYSPLRKLTAPYILRRLKTDPQVAPDLPEKTELTTNCLLTRQQATLYQSAVKQLAKELDDQKEGGIARSGLVLSYLTRFKQLCNHPSLLTGDGVFDPRHSGKYERLIALCTEIAERREKVLVFTQFRQMCQPIADVLQQVFNRPGLILHGGTAVKSRQGLVAAFQDESGPPFFVLSLKAGGTGLNLTAASHVIHFDRWWNPAVENQATDRAFRIGQKRNVLVHKFVCQGTIEERIDKLISEKSELAAQAVGAGDGSLPALSQMSNEELIGMISLDIERAAR